METTDPMDELKRLVEARGNYKANPSNVDAFHWMIFTTVNADLPAILRAWEADRAIVAKLPKTADGVPLVAGLELWPPCGHSSFITCKTLDRHICSEGKCVQEDFGENDYHDVTYRRHDLQSCYSTLATREAALAAKATSH